MRKLLLLSVLLIGAIGAIAQEPPKVEAVKFEKPLKIDGKLDDACWKTAAKIDTFALFGEDRKTRDTAMFVGHDKQWLYLGFQCAHPDPTRIPAATKDHDGAVNDDDSVEVFLDPGTDGKLYYHFKLNSIGTKAEKRVVNGNHEPQWEFPWRAATAVDKNGWTAEIAIPLYLIAAYGDLAKVRVNFARNKRVPIIDLCGVNVGTQAELSSWSPVRRSFHEMDSFGPLRGLENFQITLPFLPGYENAAVHSYYEKDGKTFYDVTCDIRAFTPEKGEALLMVTDMPYGGSARTFSERVAVKGEKPVQIKIPIAVADPSGRDVSLALALPETGEVSQAASIADTSSLNPMRAYLNLSYYAGEKTAVAVTHVNLPTKTLKGKKLVVVDAAGKVLGASEMVCPENATVFDITSLKTGVHRLQARLLRENGTMMFFSELSLTKLSPKPGVSWQIDQVNRVFLRDGKPFLPIGLIAERVNPNDEERFREIAGLGFNTLLHWQYCQPEAVSGYLALGEKHNLSIVLGMDFLFQYSVDMTAEYGKLLSGENLKKALAVASELSSPIHKKALGITPGLDQLPLSVKSELYYQYYLKNEKRLRDIVKSVMNSKSLAGYFILDEPMDFQVKTGRTLYAMLREVDGYHPVFLNYSSDIPEGDEFVEWTDALGTDPYWVPEGFGERGDVNWVSKVVAETDRRAKAFRKVAWTIPMGEYWSGCHKRAITPEEQKCQTYLALIHGSKGIVYFRYPFTHQGSADALKGIVSQLKRLAPAIVGPQVNATVQYAPVAFDPEKNIFPDVQSALFKDTDGACLLLAANSRPYPVAATYRVSGARGAVADLFGKAKAEIDGGSFADTLAAYDTRAYRLEIEPTGDDFNILVTSRSAGSAVKTLMIPNSGRPEHKNIARNPGFEDATLPGWPDYYQPLQQKPPIGTPNFVFGQDTTDPYEGKFCLRLRREVGSNGFYQYLSPQNEKPELYTYSVWIKGDRDGIRVILLGGADLVGLKETVFTVTKEWKRYAIKGVIPPKAHPYSGIQLRIVDTGTIWVDAVQLEKGTTLTEFER